MNTKKKISLFASVIRTSMSKLCSDIPTLAIGFSNMQSTCGIIQHISNKRTTSFSGLHTRYVHGVLLTSNVNYHFTISQ